MWEPRSVRLMPQNQRRHALLFSALMLIQVLAPVTFASPTSTPGISIDTDVDLELFNTVGISPSGELENGWFNPDEGVGEINLLFRDMGVIAVDDWSEWTLSLIHI